MSRLQCNEIDTKYFRWNDECQREPGYVPMGNFKKNRCSNVALSDVVSRRDGAYPFMDSTLKNQNIIHNQRNNLDV